MNKRISKYLIFSLLMLTISQLQAKNYYVAKNGTDSNDGSENAPFLTISKASSLLLAGDTCFIKAGIYREVLQPANHGANNNPIVYTNFQNDSVLISATEIVENWQQHDGNIYKANFTMNLGR